MGRAATLPPLLALAVCFLRTATGRMLADTAWDLSELAWQPESKGVYLGTPSLLPLSNGTLLGAHDYFGWGQVPARVDVLSSHDGGATWSLVAAVAGMYWANLFLHDGAAYLLGTGGVGGGAIAIARSEDGGSTWRSAELFRSPDRAVGSYATGATPLLVAQGRLWRAFELWRSPHRWPQDFEAVLASAAEGSDLMNPASWAMTPPLAFDDAWLRGHGQPAAATAGYLEGNAVEGPDGRVHVLLRMPVHLPESKVDLNHACLLTWAPGPTRQARALTSSASPEPAPPVHSPPVRNPSLRVAGGSLFDEPGTLQFSGVVSMPGGGNKFVVRRHDDTGLYVTLSNPQTTAAQGRDQRSVLALTVSDDLRTWRSVAIVLDDDTGFTYADSLRYTGFHYVDWHFNSTDILFLIRAGYRGANSMHNSNRVLFSRLQNWQQYLLQATCSYLQQDHTQGCVLGNVSSLRHVACNGMILAADCTGSLAGAPASSGAAAGHSFGPWSCNSNGTCIYAG